jgi:PTS system mannose-specific IID component
VRRRGGFPWAVLLRALAVQGSWNYETLTGTGFGFVILPALRRIHRNPAELEAAIRRHEGPFNSHPYLAPLALGAVIRMEEAGDDPEVIHRFKAALRGSLGTLGDQLVWTGWRPVCVLCALTLLLVGLPWWVAVLAFLLLYNTGHLALMVWGLSVGLDEGRGVAERLRGSALRRSQPRLMSFGTFLAGVVIALILMRGIPATGVEPGWPWLALGGVGAVAGALWGERARGVGVAGAALLAAAGLIAGVVA